MKARNLNAKPRIEGPPARKVPILLRQTSFLALKEPIQLLVDRAPNKCMVNGSQKARFGEIEQRGAAVTHKGRRLYDELLGEALRLIEAEEAGLEDADEMMEKVSQKYPDN